MSEVAARDTTFDDIIPERLWIGVTNCNGDGKLQIIVEINGIQKTIWSMKPSYAEVTEGLISEFHNLSWVLNKS